LRYLDDEQREQIGFSYIMQLLDVTTPYGIDEKKNLKPFKNRNQLLKEFETMETVTESILSNTNSYREFERIFYKIKDIRSSLRRCENGDVLDDIELYEIKYFSILLEELIGIYNNLNLNIDTMSFTSLYDLVSLLDPECKRIPTFYIYDSYSPRLKTIREEKLIIEEKIYKEIAPEKTAELKNKRLDIVILEEEEEFSIRKTLTQKILKFLPSLMLNIKSLGRLDFLVAKCNLALKLNAVRPEILDEMKVELWDAINPEIVHVLERSSKSFTPVSITLRNGTTIITGANMGGKSVTLKTIVLNLLLAQMGFYVFCKAAKLPLLDFIHFISDDMQSISKGLSTFGAEIIKLKEVIGYAKRGNGFIALDEFARGTNPREGFYLVKSLCSYLSKLNSISLISTHYDGIAENDITHYQVIGLKNVNFSSLKAKIDLNKKYSVEIIQQHMDYRLEKISNSHAVPKDALNISILLGLDDDIINVARNYYNKEDNHGK
jgi:DNA mismatch repair protein MutS2